MSATERLNLRTFELIALKDPAAVARLISLSNSAAYHRSTASKTVREAVRQLGTQASYDALLAIFALDLVDLPQQLQMLRGYLTRHIFSVLATARRLAVHAAPEDELTDQTHLAFVAILDKLGIAMALGQGQGPVIPAMLEAMADTRHLFHAMPQLDPAFELSFRVAEEWGMSAEVRRDLVDLADWENRLARMSSTAQHVLAAEAMLDAKKGRGNEALLEAPFNTWPMLQKLFARGLDPMPLVADW